MVTKTGINRKPRRSGMSRATPLSVGADYAIVNKFPLHNHPHPLILYHVQIIASQENGTSCKKTCFYTSKLTHLLSNV